VIAVRNHGLGRANAGDLVKRLFEDIGSAGGHRNMAKAVIPLRAWRRREGTTSDASIEPRLRELFLEGLMGDHNAGE
jgi:nanoRNase/pAp phosphatase (c-di-AMP/oligoRNAs hydrolase)